MPFIKLGSIVFYLKLQVDNSIPSSFSHAHVRDSHNWAEVDFTASIFAGSCSLTSFDEVSTQKIGQCSLGKNGLFFWNRLYKKCK